MVAWPQLRERSVAIGGVDQIANEGATFTNWYGQASCTAGRASFLTGRLPIRSALSIVVAPGDENHLQKQTPTIAEFFQKNGYTTYFSGKWHMGDKPDAYPTEHGFDEMRQFAAYYAGAAVIDAIEHYGLIGAAIAIGAVVLAFLVFHFVKKRLAPET